MQSDYASAFGLGITHQHPSGSIRAIDDDDEHHASSPHHQHLFMKQSSNNILSSSPPQQQQPPPPPHSSTTNLKRNRFNSVETSSSSPPTTTNTSSSSTDTVTPLHAALVAKAAATQAGDALMRHLASSKSAVLRRSHSIKLAAQLRRKQNALRSFSHTYTSPTAANGNNSADEHELEHLKFKYESFCNDNTNNEDDDDDEDQNNNENRSQYDQDADDDDDDDEDDEHESLLHHKIQQHHTNTKLKSSTTAIVPSSTLLNATSTTSMNEPKLNYLDPLTSASTSVSSDKDINNNCNINNTASHLTLDNNNLKVVIVNSNSSANLVGKGGKNQHRVDSIRMRHHSNIGNGGFDGMQQQQTSSRLKYFKCKKTNKQRSKASQRRHNYLVIFLLFVVNLLNYIDRYTLAGVLLKVQTYFDINDSQSGLLQTVFICSYMLLAPLFGYLGDRYSRKWIIIFGITFWSLMTFLGSFVPQNQFWLFVLIRSLVGIGEASYSCVAPTIIGDLFTNEMRTKMLAVFYLAVPVGSGMGYIVGSNVAEAFGDWKWALRVTPPLGFICVLVLIFVVQEPKRGGAEGECGMIDNNRTNVKEDIIYLIKNKTFMWITFGFTFASFVLGGLSWWVPAYVQYAIYSNNKIPDQIPLKFGVVTCISGLFGVALSSVLAEKLRKKTPNADPLVCALGSLIAVPSLFILILATGAVNEILFWLIAAVAISAMCLSWTIVADVLLYAIYPNRRSIASALNILICHLFGDAGSPYVIGAISDAFRKGKPDTYYNKFSSLQVALYAGPFFAALSFAAYLFAAIYVCEDKKDVDDYLRRNKQMQEAINGSGEDIDKNLTSSNESTLNETVPRLKSIKPDQNAYLNPVAMQPDMLGTTNELQLQSAPQSQQLFSTK